MDSSNISITTDVKKIDVAFVHAFLTESYWANGRTLEEVKTSMENTINFGLFYNNDKQIGFARILTDKVMFAYIMDVFIDENYRGKGYARLLMQEVLSHPDISKVKKVLLGTRDAHGLYKKLGFKNLARPEIFMEKMLS